MSQGYNEVMLQPSNEGPPLSLANLLPELVEGSGLTAATIKTHLAEAGGNKNLLAAALITAWHFQRLSKLGSPYHWIKSHVTTKAKDTLGWAENLVEEGELDRIAEFKAAGGTLKQAKRQVSKAA